jgi:hypothetical protein
VENAKASLAELFAHLCHYRAIPWPEGVLTIHKDLLWPEFTRQSTQTGFLKTNRAARHAVDNKASKGLLALW